MQPEDKEREARNQRVQKRMVMLRGYLKRPDFAGVMLTRKEIEDILMAFDEKWKMRER